MFCSLTSCVFDSYTQPTSSPAFSPSSHPSASVTICDTATVTATVRAPLTVTAVDDAQTFQATGDAVVVDVLANDETNPSGEALTVTAVTAPQDFVGTVEVSPDGSGVVYTPPSEDFTGEVTFE